MTAKEEILDLIEGDEIEAISIDDGKSKTPLFFGKDKINEGLKWLDREFEGHSGVFRYNDEPAVYVWTREWVVVQEVYEDTRGYTRIPRNPNKKICPASVGE